MYKIITPDDGYHYFFGYYDLEASQNDTHLAHRVEFFDRLPKADDIATLGTLKDGVFTPFATTTAWNFQQGALLQYHPTLQNTVLYNVNENGFKTVVHDLTSGKKSYTDRACAHISPCGKWGLAVNFGNIYDFRPGYGYAGAMAADDGVWLCNIQSGVSHKIIEHDDLYGVSGFDTSERILINHITFNTDSTKFLMLVRSFPAEGKKTWSTSLVISDLDGNMTAVLKNTMVSHYYWTSPFNMVIYCAVDGAKGLYDIDAENLTFKKYDIEYQHDIHCILSPDKNYIIGDGYPKEGLRPLYGYSLKTGKTKLLLSDPSVKPDIIDIRCDLHARFVFNGNAISFDTTKNNKRQIAIISADTHDF